MPDMTAMDSMAVMSVKINAVVADVLLVSLRPDPLFRMTIPHKTLTYMAAGRPLLAAAEGDVADVVVGAGAGMTCRPGSAEDLARAVMDLVSVSAADRAAMGGNGRAAACRLYSRELLVARVSAMLVSCVRGRIGG